jgi:hypothetical protein
MKRKTIQLTMALCFFGVALCFADDPQMGTWKLNEANSMVTPGEGKVTMVVYEAAGDNVKVTVDGTDKDGNATHNEWTGKFDGKDYPVTGDPTSDARSYKKINNRTMDFAIKKSGKVTITGRIVVSTDDKSRTVTTTGTGPNGKKVKNKAVYDKQ